MIEFLEKLIGNNEISKHKDFHNLFELLLYMCGCSENYAQMVYVKYLKVFRNTKQLEDVQLVTQSNQLVLIINNLKLIK